MTLRFCCLVFISGASSVIVGHPLDTVKVKIQQTLFNKSESKSSVISAQLWVQKALSLLTSFMTLI